MLSCWKMPWIGSVENLLRYGTSMIFQANGGNFETTFNGLKADV